MDWSLLLLLLCGYLTGVISILALLALFQSNPLQEARERIVVLEEALSALERTHSATGGLKEENAHLWETVERVEEENKQLSLRLAELATQLEKRSE